jgi:dimethylglycine catabolism B
MARPDERPLKRLPQLEARKATLERCVFCPKLCRTACPVSNAEPRETLIPWGKMSTAYFVANGSVEMAPPFAAPAWACTGCNACRESCDHRNDVAGTLFEARSALVSAGVGVPAAKRTLDRFAAHAETFRNRSKALSVLPEVDDAARTALLVGCAYARDEETTRDAVRATAKLTGGPVAVVDVCCGAPLLHAGDRARFVQQGEIFAQAIKHKDRMVVVDAGCAQTLKVHLDGAGVGMPVPVELFIERAARELGSLGPDPRLADGEAVRWHDPCQLGRGLGVYEAPRQVLARALGRAPDEFERNREGGRCSGAGGLLPVTMPEIATAIGETRVAEHRAGGGGTVVTGCASSKRMFEKQGAKVVDIVSVVARALGVG